MAFESPYKTWRSFCLLFLATILHLNALYAQNYKDPEKTQIVTTDIANFWLAFDQARPSFIKTPFQELYIEKGSKGLKGFIPGRIKSAENLALVVAKHSRYYASLKSSTDQISSMDAQIRSSLIKFDEIYPRAIFPPIYFVIGALNSGGTSVDDGLIIGAEMYGRTSETPTEELSDWLKSVIKPVHEVPHIVAHELIHFQQKYNVSNLLGACIREGSADFLAEMISGKHINQHVHDFANPLEKELWAEFKVRMMMDDYTGWLYSASPGRPNDLGYWIGYKITKAYYDRMPNKTKAIHEILTMKNVREFLDKSEYASKFN